MVNSHSTKELSWVVMMHCLVLPRFNICSVRKETDGPVRVRARTHKVKDKKGVMTNLLLLIIGTHTEK